MREGGCSKRQLESQSPQDAKNRKVAKVSRPSKQRLQTVQEHAQATEQVEAP